MSTIKKINIFDLGKELVNAVEPKSWNPDKNMADLINNPYVEEMPLKLDEPIKYDQLKKIETKEDVIRYIELQKAAGVPDWKIIASIAKIAALPKKRIVKYPTNEKGEKLDAGDWWAVGQRKPGLPKDYLAVHDLAANILIAAGRIEKIDDLAYGSCAQAAAAVIIPIYDSELPNSSPKEQYEYLTGKGKENGKWKEVNVNNNGETTIKEGMPWSNYDLRPGDLILTEQAADETQHVMIYIGEEAGVPTFFEAEAHKRDYSVYPYITRQPIVDDHKNGITTDPEDKPDRQYHVFRPNV